MILQNKLVDIIMTDSDKKSAINEINLIIEKYDGYQSINTPVKLFSDVLNKRLKQLETKDENYLKKVFGESETPKNLKEHLIMRHERTNR